MSRKTKKRKKYRGKKSKKFLRRLRNFVIICAVIVGLIFGVDYYRNGNVSRTLGYVQTVSEYLDSAVEQVVRPAADFVEEKISEVTRPALLFVEEKANRFIEFTADKIESLHVGPAEKIAEVLRGWGGPKNVGNLEEIPVYAGKDYVTVNGNVPLFTEEEKASAPYEYYSNKDVLGRCGYAEAKLAPELMPVEARGEIGAVRPSGWKTIKYSIIDGLYLYNRCHLIGYQLAGENANEKNLITGTRYMNVTGMLPWENLVAEYIRKTGDYVMYRVTPVYDGDDLVAKGVQIEAESLESDEICFNVFVFNVQPGIEIDYSNGNSWMSK